MQAKLIGHRLGHASHYAVALFFLFAGTSSVSAHSKMNSSVPADGATVPVGLEQIEFVFSDALRLTLVKVKAAGSKVVAAFTPAKLPEAAAQRAALQIPSLGPGQYTVDWTGIGKDGHVMRGSFAFTVKQD